MKESDVAGVVGSGVLEDERSRVWMAMRVTERTSRSKLQRDSSFYRPRGKVYKGL